MINIRFGMPFTSSKGQGHVEENCLISGDDFRLCWNRKRQRSG
jgi:hypothetical protein